MTSWVNKIKEIVQDPSCAFPSQHIKEGQLFYRIGLNGYNDKSSSFHQIHFIELDKAPGPFLSLPAPPPDPPNTETDNLGASLFHTFRQFEWKSPIKLVIHLTNRSNKTVKSGLGAFFFARDQETPEKAILEFANHSIFYYFIEMHPATKKMISTFSDSVKSASKGHFFEIIPGWEGESKFHTYINMVVAKTLLKNQKPQ